MLTFFKLLVNSCTPLIYLRGALVFWAKARFFCAKAVVTRLNNADIALGKVNAGI
jgi:hypothetical protein